MVKEYGCKDNKKEKKGTLRRESDDVMDELELEWPSACTPRRSSKRPGGVRCMGHGVGTGGLAGQARRGCTSH